MRFSVVIGDTGPNFSTRISVERLCPEHLPALAIVLRVPEVYTYISGGLPSEQDFLLGLTRALAGPPPHRTEELWLNYLVRRAGSGEILGRLECTVINRVAEVAFLFATAVWGQGYAREGLEWLHAEVERRAGRVGFWATTHPDNIRCQKLLARAGYREVCVAEAPQLVTYEAGDRVFNRPAHA